MPAIPPERNSAFFKILLIDFKRIVKTQFTYFLANTALLMQKRPVYPMPFTVFQKMISVFK